MAFDVRNKNLHLILCILLCRDTNPGPVMNRVPKVQRFLSFNARSLLSINKREDGTSVSNLRSFHDLVYAENLDVVLVTETWLNDNVSDGKILPSGYNIITIKRSPSNKRAWRWCFVSIA